MLYWFDSCCLCVFFFLAQMGSKCCEWLPSTGEVQGLSVRQAMRTVGFARLAATPWWRGAKWTESKLNKAERSFFKTFLVCRLFRRTFQLQCESVLKKQIKNLEFIALGVVGIFWIFHSWSLLWCEKTSKSSKVSCFLWSRCQNRICDVYLDLPVLGGF